MPLFNMTDLRAALAPGQRLLGIDLGSRMIGLALTDVTLMLASPFGEIPRGKLAINAAAISKVAIALADERLSSSAVNRFLIGEADMTRKRRAEVVDRMAAAYMLQGALDASLPVD